MRTMSDNIMDRLDDLTSSVEFIKSKMMKDECDQMSKGMKQDEEKWKREEYNGGLCEHQEVQTVRRSRLRRRPAVHFGAQ